MAAKAAPLTTEAPKTAKATSPTKQTDLTPEVPCYHGARAMLSLFCMEGPKAWVVSDC